MGKDRKCHRCHFGGKRDDHCACPTLGGSKNCYAAMYEDGVPEPYYKNGPNENPAAKELLDFHKREASAFLGLTLGTVDHEPGGMVLLTERGQDNESQLRLISLLKDSLQAAVANALQHSEIVELKDRVADDNKVLLMREFEQD